MAHVEKHAPGTFCWVELGTTDQEAAKNFYSALFGWTFVDHPMGPSDVYTMFQLGGRTSAAAYQMGEREKGMPPRWNLYVAVENADARAAQAVELGGATPAGVFDVNTAGRMSIVIDPAGAALCIWQANMTPGLQVMNEDDAYCWADLMTSDRAKAKQFYQGLFDWKMVTGDGKDDSSYLHITKDGKGIGGMQQDERSHWMAYFQTSSADDKATKTQSLGGKILLPPTQVDKGVRIAILADPQGAVFALYQK